MTTGFGVLDTTRRHVFLVATVLLFGKAVEYTAVVFSPLFLFSRTRKMLGYILSPGEVG